MVENRELSLENPIFTPIDERTDSKRGYKLVIISLEGPNGVGKSSIHKLVPTIVQAAHYLSDPEDYPMPPIVGVIEPPNLKVEPDNPLRTDTWRNYAKSGYSPDNVTPTWMFDNAVFRAGMFLWGRRLIEEEVANRFPFFVGRFKENCIYPRISFDYGRRMVRSDEELKSVGLAVLLKDRGTGSTLKYQGSDPEVGNQVYAMVEKLYRTGFLRKENMTIVVMPYDSSSTQAFILDRNEDEEDQFTDEEGFWKYRELREKSGIFSKRWVEIRNDPSGVKNKISSPVLITSMLVIAAEQEALGRVKIREGEKFRIPFSMPRLQKLLEDMLERYTPGISGGLEESIREIVSGDTFPLWKIGGCRYVSGDVGITKIHRDYMELIIQPNLSEKE